MWRRPSVLRRACTSTGGNSFRCLNGSPRAPHHGLPRYIHNTSSRRALDVHALIAEKLRQYSNPNGSEPSKTPESPAEELPGSSSRDVTETSSVVENEGFQKDSLRGVSSMEDDISSQQGNRFSFAAEAPASESPASIRKPLDATSDFVSSSSQKTEDPPTPQDANLRPSSSAFDIMTWNTSATYPNTGPNSPDTFDQAFTNVRRQESAVKVAHQPSIDKLQTPKAQTKQATTQKETSVARTTPQDMFLLNGEPAAVWTIVDTVESVSRMVDSLNGGPKDRPSLYCSVLTPDECCGILIFALHRSEIFAIDVEKLGAEAFSIQGTQSANNTLKDILQAAEITKVFDALRDSLAHLYHRYSVDVAGGVDIPIMAATSKETEGSLRMFDTYMEKYLTTESWRARKDYHTLVSKSNLAVNRMYDQHEPKEYQRRFNMPLFQKAWRTRLQVMPSMYSFYDATPGDWRTSMSDMTSEQIAMAKDPTWNLAARDPKKVAKIRPSPGTSSTPVKVVREDRPTQARSTASNTPAAAKRSAAAKTSAAPKPPAAKSSPTQSAIEAARRESTMASLLRLHRVSKELQDPEAKQFFVENIEHIAENMGCDKRAFRSKSSGPSGWER